MSSPPPLRPTAGRSGYHRRAPLRGRGGLIRRPWARRCTKTKQLVYSLMEERDEGEQQRVQELELEVSELETALDREQRLGRVLRCSLQGRVVCHCCLAALVPTKVRSLLGELAMVEDEIFYLEKKVDDLRLRLHRKCNDDDDDRRVALEHRPTPPQQRDYLRQPRRSGCGLGCRRKGGAAEQLPRLPSCPAITDHDERESEASVRSASVKGREEVEQTRRSSHCHSSSILVSGKSASPPPPADHRRTCLDSPNKLSEDLVRLTVTVFHKLRKTAAEPPKLNISCIGGSRSLVPKAAAMSPLKSRSGSSRAAKEEATTNNNGGCRRRFVEFTRGSVDVGRVSLCLVDIKNLRGLMQKLSVVDPSFLTNKQKLAFWINVYNFCVMHAFLQHGLPPSPDKLLALLNQASVNVGGAVLNVVTIEHLILRHSPEGRQGLEDEDGEEERDLLRSYGLGYPEPNVVFALCRGSRSSPALRVYSAEDVSNELERAKVEYLEWSVRVAGRRQAVLPRLLHWHMRDFADDAASLLEWVHSQLPRGALKRAVREVLATTTTKMLLEVEPYDADFCYMLPVLGC